MLSRSEKRYLILFAAVCAAYLAAYSVINFCGFEKFINMDMYGDTYVSRLMWEQKTLFPENWVFGNQFYVFATPTLAALLYGLCGSMNLAMVLATTIMMVLTIAAFVWMVRPLFGTVEIAGGVAMLLGCIIGPMAVDTIQGQIFYVMCSYYASYAITMFLVFGDYIRCVTGGGLRLRSGIAAMVLSFCTGMHSLRQTAVMIAPLLLVEGIRMLALWLREKRFPQAKEWRASLRVLACTAANLAGVLVIRWIDPLHYTIFGEIRINSAEQLRTAIQRALSALSTLTGVRYLWEGHVLHGILGLALIALLIWAVVVLLRQEMAGEKRLLAGLLAASVVVTMMSSLVLAIQLRSIYMFAWYPLLAVGAILLLSALRGRWRALCALTCSLILMCNLAVSYLPCVQRATEEGTTTEQSIAQYLTDNGYTRLYGDWYWTARIAVWTDGAVTAGVWNAKPLYPLGFINPIDIYTAEDNAAAAYLVTATSEDDLLSRAEELGAAVELAAEFANGSLRLYTSDKQLMHPPGFE